MDLWVCESACLLLLCEPSVCLSVNRWLRLQHLLPAKYGCYPQKTQEPALLIWTNVSSHSHWNLLASHCLQLNQVTARWKLICFARFGLFWSCRRTKSMVLKYYSEKINLHSRHFTQARQSKYRRKLNRKWQDSLHRPSLPSKNDTDDAKMSIIWIFLN